MPTMPSGPTSLPANLTEKTAPLVPVLISPSRGDLEKEVEPKSKEVSAVLRKFELIDFEAVKGPNNTTIHELKVESWIQVPKALAKINSSNQNIDVKIVFPELDSNGNPYSQEVLNEQKEIHKLLSQAHKQSPAALTKQIAEGIAGCHEFNQALKGNKQYQGGDDKKQQITNKIVKDFVTPWFEQVQFNTQDQTLLRVSHIYDAEAVMKEWEKNSNGSALSKDTLPSYLVNQIREQSDNGDVIVQINSNSSLPNLVQFAEAVRALDKGQGLGKTTKIWVNTSTPVALPDPAPVEYTCDDYLKKFKSTGGTPLGGAPENRKDVKPTNSDDATTKGGKEPVTRAGSSPGGSAAPKSTEPASVDGASPNTKGGAPATTSSANTDPKVAEEPRQSSRNQPNGERRVGGTLKKLVSDPFLAITKLGEKTVEVANGLLARKQLTEDEPTIQNQESDTAQQVSPIAGSTPNSEVTPSSSELVEQQIAEHSTVTGAVTGKILEGENLTDISDNLVTSAEEKGGEEPPTAPRVNEIVAVREDGASSNDSAPAALEAAPSVLPADEAEGRDATSQEELTLPPVAKKVDVATENNSETSEESTQVVLKKSDTHLPEPLKNPESSVGNRIDQASDDSTPAVAQKESVEENDTEIQTARLPPSDIFINMQGTDQSVGNEDEAKEKNDSRNT